MNREQLQKVRDALEGVVVARHPASCIEALRILDRALAAPKQVSSIYKLDGFPESIGATYTLPCEIVWQGAVNPTVGSLLRIVGVHGRHLYLEQPAPQSAQPTDCTRIMREQGKPYPRTCPRCKLGPCAYSPTIAVTAPPSRESVQPVAEVVAHLRGEHIGMVMIRSSEYLLLGTKLYTAPPSREWQGLSDEELAPPPEPQP